MSKKMLYILTMVIALTLIVLSFFVDDIMPYTYGALALNLINIVAYTNNKDLRKK